MPVLESSILGQNIHCVAQTLSPTSTFTWYPLDTNQKERVTAGTWRSIARLTLGGFGSLALVGCPSRRGNSGNKPTGRRDLSALVGIHLGVGNSEF